MINDERIPRDPGANQYLVTDGEGKTGWEQRLAWKEIEEKELFNQKTAGFVFDSIDNLAYYEVQSPFGEIIIGRKYTVVWDGVEHPDLVAFFDEGAAAIGAPYADIGNESPFNIATFFDVQGGAYILSFATNSTAESHDIRIAETQDTIHPIPAEYLPDTVSYFYAANGNTGILTDVLYKDIELTEAVTAKELSDALSGGIVRINHPTYTNETWFEPFVITNKYKSDKDHSVSVTCLVEEGGSFSTFKIEYSASDK